MKIYFILLLILILKINSEPECILSQNYCKKCNPITNLCFLCEQPEIFIPNENGGCSGSKRCYPGKNYCHECDVTGELCQKCDIGLFPDQNGGCSYSNFCKISYKGECIECIENYIIVGEKYNFKFCKSIFSDDFLNCEIIDNINGVCQKCKEGFYLTRGDRKCIKTKDCHESIFGNCVKCISGYYYNKQKDECIPKTGNWLYCKQTIDGEQCDICDDYHYLDEKGMCTFGNFCSESINGKCIKCREGYYLTSDSHCSNTNNCFNTDTDTGICNYCESQFYLDTKDYKCKSNLENNGYKHCIRVKNDLCVECYLTYFLGKDSKCCSTRECIESENGICKSCSDNYYLGLDNKCIDVENCIYSDGFNCTECDTGFYYNSYSRKCLKEENQFINCKITNDDGTLCGECDKDFYLNKSDNICYDNTEKNNLYKCAYADNSGEVCEQCIKGYYLGSEDKKCSLIENCDISEDENKCNKCVNSHCLDVKNNVCVNNGKILDENIKIYYKCIKTNEDGNKCEECVDGFELKEEGYCVNVDKCQEVNDGICVKCEDVDNNNELSFCANKVLGCVETTAKNCLRCDDILNFNMCTKCKEGYIKNIFGCQKENK